MESSHSRNATVSGTGIESDVPIDYTFFGRIERMAIEFGCYPCCQRATSIRTDW